MSGIIGTKCGTSRGYVSGSKGTIDQVTLIKVDPNYVTDLILSENRGYAAIQLASIPSNEKKMTKSEYGCYKKLGLQPQRVKHEVRVKNDSTVNSHKIGDILTVDFFEGIESVDVISTSKGKGFAGCVKRHNFSMQRATHGNSLSHRAPGSIGQCQFPGRVNPGKKMAGRMGGARITVKNLAVIAYDTEESLLIVKGSVPGAKGGVVIIKTKKLEGR